MYRPSLNLFAEKAEELFWPLISNYGYELKEIKFEQYSVHLIYFNANLDQSITVENAIHGYDYGFSIFIKNNQSNKEVLLLNFPNEKQDAECKFLQSLVFEFFNNSEMITHISTFDW